MRRLLMIATPVAVALTLGAAASAQPRSAPCDRTPDPFEDATLIVETNATDGDAGLQVSSTTSRGDR